MTRRKLICRLVLLGGILLYPAALAIALIGTQGWFGVQPDGLAAIWLVFLGMPWTMAMAPFLMVGLPVIVGQAVAVGAPLVNLWLLGKLCRGRGDENAP